MSGEKMSYLGEPYNIKKIPGTFNREEEVPAITHKEGPLMVLAGPGQERHL